MSECGGCCNKDMHTLHAELIHKALDIRFQLNYDNGGNPASIIDIDKKNVQFALESYWSKAGLPILNEIPGGVKNRVNLLFTTAFEFIPGTLEVYLSGLHLNGDQSDPDRDFNVNGTNDGFTLILAPNKPFGLNCPPFKNEPLYVNYRKRITFDTKGGT